MLTTIIACIITTNTFQNTPISLERGLSELPEEYYM